MTQSTKTSAMKQAFTWITGIITFIMVLAACGFLIVSKNKTQNVPAEIIITSDEKKRLSHQHVKGTRGGREGPAPGPDVGPNRGRRIGRAGG